MCASRQPRRRGANFAEYDAIEALERRAGLDQIAPSTLTRNLIRLGMTRRNAVTADLVDELEAVTSRFRAVVP